jgi:hypothetical protein
MSIDELSDDDHTLKLLTLLNVAAARPHALKRKRIPERDWTALAKSAKKASIQAAKQQPESAPAQDSVAVAAEEDEKEESAAGEPRRPLSDLSVFGI